MTAQIEETQIEAALRRRVAQRRDGDDEHRAALETLALSWSGHANEDERRAAAAHLHECVECAEAVVTLQGLQAERVVPLPIAQTGDDEERPGGGGRLLRFPVFVAAAAALAAALAVFVLRPTTIDPIVEPPQLVPMGSEDSISLSVQRGTNRFDVSPGDILKTGDNVVIFYSTPRRSQFAVIHVDDAGETTALYPAHGQRTSVAVRSGADVALPDGARLTAGSGCEWFVAVFSDDVLDLDDVDAAASKAARAAAPAGDGGCRMLVDLPGARSIIALSTRRSLE